MNVNRFRAAVLLLGVVTLGLGIAAGHQPSLANTLASQDKKQRLEESTAGRRVLHTYEAFRH